MWRTQRSTHVSHFRALTLCGLCDARSVCRVSHTHTHTHSLSLSIRVNTPNIDYVDEHPGGSSILRNAGRDSTEGFLGACVCVCVCMNGFQPMIRARLLLCCRRVNCVFVYVLLLSWLCLRSSNNEEKKKRERERERG